ncbi:type II toxin-antitoxin system HipA family toxin [Aminobacter sp. MET-1]|uniref:type II toxin-antitoxin system HipA family toxin n=1 Tax=Aminobacter sp. MET-1 TaxID=2951085 RepID=UPI00226A0C37|nr:type II toxin-antitoxin system HipA family toxin [Aminobacter sp. MET-1]MCX8570835.1 type II toxin-antitoxin system HipA family toxin [Aminobacter sp. MET-1]
MIMVNQIDVLDVYIAGRPVGELHHLQSGKLSFSYHEAWMEGRVAIPLSLSMPTITRTYAGKVIEAFLWGLLPDNEQTLSRWAQRFQVSARNPFALLKNVGRDCAGAVQFLPHGDPLTRGEDVVLLSEAQIGERLRDLRRDGAATRRIGDPGQFSLAGAQAKTAFHYDKDNNRWGIPLGDTPTTHIFKPPMPHLHGHTENEHFCLQLANKLGMDAAHSQVRDFAGEKAIVVERYDRRNIDGKTIRIHQEDMCQALSVMPTLKYENQGGPGVTTISNKVISASLNPVGDRQSFMAANVFNWIIAGTDAHAKNYSMLLGAQGEARLAPLYDISSILPHLGEGEVQAEMRDLKLAMKIDRTYLIDEIMPRHWERCASSAKVNGEYTMQTIRHQLAVTPDLSSDCAQELRKEGIMHEVVDRLVDAIATRIKSLSRIYGEEAAAEPVEVRAGR